MRKGGGASSCFPTARGVEVADAAIASFASALLVIAFASSSCGGDEPTQAAATSPKPVAQIIRETELARIEALTAADIGKARPFHADDFRLTAPNGQKFTKDEYLDAVGSGRLDYVLWEPISPVEVTVQGDEATVRYRSKIGSQEVSAGQLSRRTTTPMRCVTGSGGSSDR